MRAIDDIAWFSARPIDESIKENAMAAVIRAVCEQHPCEKPCFMAELILSRLVNVMWRDYVRLN